MEPPLRVGQLAEATSVPAKTIRYYEQVGVPAASRSAAGYRQYYRRDIDRLLFIRRARSLGLPLARLHIDEAIIALDLGDPALVLDLDRKAEG
jgi:DNA-binding transcriptional MerR regulator